MADGYKTMVDMLKSSLSERKESYGTTDIQKIIIDGNEFGGYKTFSSYWEKTYVKQPERSSDGTIGNLNSYASFITFHLKVNFAMMSIDDYRRLYDLMLSRNEFTVTAYNVLTNKPHTCKMYFAPDQMPTLYAVARRLQGEKYLEVLGVQDYTIELIGTNASMEKVDILFYDENDNLIPNATKSVDKGVEVVINYDYKAPSGYRFDGKWKKENGSIVRNGDTISPIDNVILKVDLVKTNEYTLSLDYGIGIKPTTLYSDENIDTFPATYYADGRLTFGQIIKFKNVILADNSTFSFPSNGTGVNNVYYNGKTYSGADAYTFDGWFTTPKMGGKEIFSHNGYTYQKNLTIYQRYTPKKYTLSFSIKPPYGMNPISVSYGERVYLPKYQIEGETFKGWYWKDGEEEIEFDGIMPPFNLTIYAKWE